MSDRQNMIIVAILVVVGIIFVLAFMREAMVHPPAKGAPPDPFIIGLLIVMFVFDMTTCALSVQR